MSEFSYVGSELQLFTAATNWKNYWASVIRPFIGQEVLEVGAGLGTNTRFLDAGGRRRWVCLEPDPQLLDQLARNLALASGQGAYETICGTVAEIDRRERFDTIIYIDVLEHIEDDYAELRRAGELLRSGGRIIVLSPAHNWLFTPFDRAIGHFRRYNRSMLRGICPEYLEFERLHYVDSVGVAASAANRLFLQQSMPTRSQVRMWDSYMVPISRYTDRLLFHSIGKSIIAVLRRGPSV